MTNYPQSSCKSGDATKIVIQLNDTVTQKYYSFCIKVDELSELTLNGCRLSSDEFIYRG